MKRAAVMAIPRTRRWSVAQARGVLEALQESGLPVTRFAAQHSLGAERLYQWRRRLGREQKAASQPTRFTEVRVALPSSGPVSRLDDALRVIERLAAR